VNLPATIEARQRELEQVLELLWPKDQQHGKSARKVAASTSGRDCTLPLDDGERARWKRLGNDKRDRILALWSGDASAYGGDESRADLALCFFLLVLTNGDRHRSEQLFGESVPGKRTKWTTRQDYRDLTFEQAAEGFTPWRDDPAGRNGQVPPPAGPAPAGQSGAAIILEYFREHYRPAFREGNTIHCQDGREVPMSEACAVPTSPLIKRLEVADDAPKYKGGGLIPGSLPGFFARWARVAWGDLLESLPDEDEAELGHEAEAAELFHRLVREALCTEVVLGDMVGKTGVTQTERNSLINWCQKFAKVGPWRAIRGKRCWCKLREVPGGELVLMVAIRHELFAQVKADRRLCAMGPKRFARRAARYRLGKASEDERPHGQRAVVFHDAFIAGLVEGLPEICRSPQSARDPAEGQQESETEK
jgi:hypothetical protein